MAMVRTERCGSILVQAAANGLPESTGPYTVKEAAEHYLAWYKEHRKAFKETEHSVRVHILPALGNDAVSDLTAPRIRKWLDKVAEQPGRVRTSKLAKRQNFRAAPKTEDAKRARRATANRVFNILKALLNKAFHDGMISDDTAWRQVKPFPKVDEARIRFLTGAEAIRLVNSCVTDLRHLTQAALLTGARYGELTALTVNDVDTDVARIYIAQSKSGRPRHIPLNREGVKVFVSAVAGKSGNEIVFTRTDGQPWKKNHHVRPLAEACRTAKIKPSVAFHELRHTYASHLAQQGVDLLTISKLLGHADTRITSKHYAHLADATLAAAVTKLPSFGQTENAKVRAIR